ncbi:MAG: ABC transporter substrate-binding protein [Nostoc sp.]
MVQHAMGETCIPLNPQRIVILRGEPILHVLALDVKPIIAVFGFEELFNSPYIKNRLNGIEAILTSNSGPSFEKLLLLKPDCVSSVIPFKLIEKFMDCYHEFLPRYYCLRHNLHPVYMIGSNILLTWQKYLKKVEIANQLIDNYKHRAEELKQKINNHHHGKLSVSYLEIFCLMSYILLAMILLLVKY